jgi:cellulose synthase/poly-beta-1,6-N-acetylglucosamine synthase-like glycosyltransferase
MIKNKYELFIISLLNRMTSEFISSLLATVSEIILIPFILVLSILAILAKKTKKERRS